jgi:fructokinase
MERIQVDGARVLGLGRRHAGRTRIARRDAAQAPGTPAHRAAAASSYNAGVRIGIDVGGTKIEGVALADDGSMLSRRRLETPRGDYDATVEAIASVVEAIERECGRRGSVGVGIPGAISPATGLVKNANSTWLIGKPFEEDLQARLRRPVRIANDANCFALSEAVDGAAAGADVVFGVIVGTGTGGGIVVGGRILVGAHAIAGEWGHNPLPWAEEDEHPGPACYCGRRGCIETFLSGPGLARAYQEACGHSHSPREIAEHARAGVPHAVSVMTRYADRFARALASIINVLDPDVIVLGGGLSNIDWLYSAVPARWSRHVFSDVVSTRLIRAAHGDSSGVRGAAWLWPATH